MTDRRPFLAARAAAALRPTLARAQAASPTRPLRVVVPFPPGGTTDYVTRLVCAEVARGLGQAVVVARYAEVIQRAHITVEG